MNLETLISIAFKSKTYKFKTLDFLTSYYQAEGNNIFKASEKAESNKQNFIGFAQHHIDTAQKNNYCSLFDSVDASIVVFNQSYPIVSKIATDLKDLTWQEFESFCGVLLRKCFKADNISISPPSNDGGVDFSAKLPFKTDYSTKPNGSIELYGQAKKYSGNVSRIDVDKFTAFANRQKRDNQYPAQLFLFCTTSDFNSNAQNEIEKNHFIGLNGLQIANLVYGYMISIDYDGVDYLNDFFHQS